jgi:hypothetical protein
MNRITSQDDLFDLYLMGGMQCYNNWDSDEEAITAVIIRHHGSILGIETV